MESARAHLSAPDRPLGNLPLELTSFIGREREVAEVERLLGDRRLLTLCGPGGAGKTRLALAVAQELVEEFEDGVWWVELAPLSDPRLVPRAIAAVLGVPESQDTSSTEDLVEHLKPRETLLILDNCEHLVEACADLADRLLRTCPDLEILATSREPLRVSGENSWQVPSLSLPDPGRLPELGELAGFEAIDLFVERARSVDAGFELTEENAPAVARLCQKLDGIPLAIELAAARSRVLTAGQILEKLEDPLTLLTTGDRSAAPRQRTLRATLEWSYDLLSEDERALFRRLSVFVGGWGLEAAEAVGAGEPVEAGLVLDLLSALLDKSLVVAEENEEEGSSLRYRMLVPVRQFGREKLAESTEAQDTPRRHAEYFLDLAEKADPKLVGPDQARWLQRLRTELGNLRRALEWSLEPDQEERAELRLRLVAALGRFWGREGFEEGKWGLQVALERDPGGFPVARAKALGELGFILLFQQNYAPAMAALEEGVAIYKELGDETGAAYALANLGQAAVHGGFRERLPSFEREGAELLEGDLADHPRAYLLVILGMAAQGEGDLDRAASRLEEGLALCRELGSLREASMAHFILGNVEIDREHLDRGVALLLDGARITRELGDQLGTAYYVWGLGRVAVLRKNPERAARLWGAAESLREHMGMTLSVFDLNASGYEVDLAAVRSSLGDASFDAAWAEGRAMSPEQATDYVLQETATPYREIPAGRTSPAPHTPQLPDEDGGNDLRNNLPVARSGFVGREREMSEVKRALASTRLLTLTGAGGSGKTRLALEVARDLAEADAYPDGVWLVELASLTEGDLVAGAVAAALGLREQPDLPFTEALVDFLRSRRILLILDNCEHLAEDCARLVDKLLSTCEHLCVMATSREALGVAGEVNWMVPSLTVPEAEAVSDPESLTRYEAVRLFVGRARLRVPAFELTHANAAAVADVCRRLDGMPLAIELATARMGALSVEQISERLGHSLDFLKTGERTAAPRQRTLRAALRWSYDLLLEPERELFRRLSVFAGGWTLDAAEAVGEGGQVKSTQVLDLLSALVDKSLLVVEADAGGDLRYRMLEPVRQYALELLEEGGETRARHAAFFVALAEEAYPKLRAAPQVEWLRKLDKENGNLRGALSWALSADEIPTAARLGFALWPFWWIRNRQIEGRRWTERVLLGRDKLPPPLQIRATIAAAAMAYGQGDADALPRFTAELVELSRAVGGDVLAEAYAQAGFGLVATAQGDFEAATPRLEEALPLFREAGEDGMAAQTPSWLGTILLFQGDHEGARRRFEEGLAMARSLGERVSTHNALFNLAQLELAEGDYEAAFLRFTEAIAPAEELGDRGSIAWILEGLGVVAGAQGEAERAARLLGASEAMISAIGLRGHPEYALDRALYERIEAGARATLDEAAFEAAKEEGRSMAPERAIEYALEVLVAPQEETPTKTSAPVDLPVELPKEDTGGRRNNLPAARGGLVGREREMSEVGHALSTTRLLTLTGAGGCGKTRLALEVARNIAGDHPDEYPDGVWFVGLASLTDGALVPGAVAAALGVRERPDLSVTDSLVDFLRSRRMLLVLDNCEHLIDDCARLVDMLVDSCENLRVMATSREALGVAGEVNWMVPSLTTPDAEDLPDPEGLTRYEAVRLFVERAQSRAPGFALAPENAAAVADICRKLDGIPLAIELATARMGALSVEQISERLTDALGFLTTGDRTRAPRQRTLRAALQWGYELLGEGERELFGRLSVFVGGWTLEAAERVGAAGDVSAGQVLDLLSRLVDQSLVMAETVEDGPRYRMLEPIRQYALELLERRGEAHDVRDRHAALFASLAEQAHTELRGPGQVAWMHRIDQEHDNLRAAMAWALSSGDCGTAALLGWALWPFWFYRGFQREGRRLMERVLEDGAALPLQLRIRATVSVAVMAYGQGDDEAVVEYMTDLLELSRQAGGDAYAEGYARAGLGLVAMNRGDLVRAAARLEEALPLFIECGELWTAAQTHTWLGTVLLLQGDQEQAVARFEEGLALARWIGDRAAIYNALYTLAQVALDRDELELATSRFVEGMGLSEEMKDLANVAYCLEGLATVAGARGEAGCSARLFGAAQGMHETIGVPVWTYYNPDRSLYERTMDDLRTRLGEQVYEAAFSEGRAMSPERAIEYALEQTSPEPPAPEPALPPAPVPVEEHQVRLRIFALGPARVEKEGLPLDSPDWIQKSRELLFYLLSHSGGRTKEQIGLALWPEASTAQLRSSFHDTVFRLRRALGGKEWVVFEKRRYAFGRSLDYAYDVEDFEWNLSEARRLLTEAPDRAILHLQKAAGLYGGDFLEDIAQSEWTLERQEELRRAYGESLLLLGGLLVSQERHAEASEAYRKAISHDRFLEEAHRGLIRSQASLGERGRALRHYEELVALLQEQLGASPAPETTDLYERLRAGKEA